MPDVMPAHFVSAFTPIDVAGTEGQMKHVSRLLAAQITAHQLGPEAALQTRRVSKIKITIPPKRTLPKIFMIL